MKLINIISRLSKVPAAQKWNGKILFNIFKKYAPDALRQCYRTLWTQYIARYSLINYGLNDPNTFLMEEKAYQDKNLYQQAKFNAINQLLKMYTNKEYKPNETMFAKPIHDKPMANTKPNTIDPNKPVVNPGSVPPAKPGTTNQPSKSNNIPPGNDDIIY